MAKKVMAPYDQWHTKMGEEMIKDGEIESDVAGCGRRQIPVDYEHPYQH